MDLTKSLKNANNAILFFILNICITFIFTIIYIILIALLVGINQPGVEMPYFTIFMVGVILFACSLIAINVVFIIYYILVLIDASKDKDDQTNFILLIVGIFFNILGIIAIFLHRSRVKDLIAKNDNSQQQYY